MLDGPSLEFDDITLVCRMSQGDQDALRLMLKKYGGRVKAALKRKYQGILAEPEIEQAVLDGAFQVWRFASRFEVDRGSLGDWFLAITFNAAAGIIRGYRKMSFKELAFDPVGDHASWWSGGSSATTTTFGRESRLIRDLNEAIGKLPPLQRAVIQADLAAGGKADTERLAAQLGSNEKSVQAARSKAKSALRTLMAQKGHLTEMQRGRR
jgi:DNA-directed RNA polymerase specialized sigma24 family protein